MFTGQGSGRALGEHLRTLGVGGAAVTADRSRGLDAGVGSGAYGGCVRGLGRILGIGGCAGSGVDGSPRSHGLRGFFPVRGQVCVVPLT